MDVKKDMANATSGGTQMEISTPAVGKYNEDPSEKLRRAQRTKVFLYLLLWFCCEKDVKCICRQSSRIIRFISSRNRKISTSSLWQVLSSQKASID